MLFFILFINTWHKVVQNGIVSGTFNMNLQGDVHKYCTEWKNFNKMKFLVMLQGTGTNKYLYCIDRTTGTGIGTVSAEYQYCQEYCKVPYHTVLEYCTVLVTLVQCSYSSGTGTRRQGTHSTGMVLVELPVWIWTWIKSQRYSTLSCGRC